MSSPTYYSAIYIINRSKQNASRMCLPDYECDFLPKQMKLMELAVLVANMQKICFEDGNKKMYIANVCMICLPQQQNEQLP